MEVSLHPIWLKPSASVLALCTVLVTAAPALSSAFVAWRVSGVPAGDILNVRANPGSDSKILAGYANGTVLSMTGKCTGGVDLMDIQTLSSWKQRQIVRHAWCQAWLDPKGNGKFMLGWIYGRYVRPA